MTAPEITRLVIGPNASLSGRQAVWVLVSMAVVGFSIAGFFAALGFWMILPFAGLELAALAAALWVSVGRNRYREVLCFERDRLVVELGLLGKGAQSRVVLSRSWTRAMIENGMHRHDPTRLLLTCSGQKLEIGRCLTDQEREHLCQRIKELLNPAWRALPGGAGGSPARELPLGE